MWNCKRPGLAPRISNPWWQGTLTRPEKPRTTRLPLAPLMASIQLGGFNHTVWLMCLVRTLSESAKRRMAASEGTTSCLQPFPPQSLPLTREKKKAWGVVHRESAKVDIKCHAMHRVT